MDEALAQLYLPEVLTLTMDENGGVGADFNYDAAVFERAAEWIHSRGEFTPDMMREAPAREVIAETYRILGGAVSSSIPVETPDNLVGALQNNAFVFSGFKSYHSLHEVGLSLVGTDGGLKPFEEFSRDVEKIDAKYNRNYLRAEYHHAVASSQMAARWHDFAEDGDRYDLQYRTADDERVRKEHLPLHNITLPFDDPFWEQFTPPNGWRCRCSVVQVRKGKYPTSDSAQAMALGERITDGPKQRMFRFNPGTELKVFPDKHPYMPKGCGSCGKSLQLAYDPKRDMCRVCDAIAKQAREKEKERRKEVDAKVKEWIAANKPSDGRVSSDAFETGVLVLNSKSVKRYLSHAINLKEKWLLKYLLQRPGTLKYIRFSPLGETKNMDDPVQAKNVAKKAERGVIGYNLYEFELHGKVWIMGFETIKKDKKTFEQPYFVKPKKP